jgi:membrane fusion protein (multidrug efflux system)
MKHRFKLILLVSFITILNSCSDKNKAEQPKQQIATYPVTIVENKTLTGYDVYPTNIEGIINSDIRAKIAGYISAVLIDEGQKVKKGEPLFRIETQSMSQDAKALEAGVKVAQMEVNKLKPLVDKGIISDVQLETAKANLEQAKSNYNSILANIGYATVKSPIDGWVGSVNFREGALISPSNGKPLTTVVNTKQVFAYFSMNEKEYLNFLQKSEGTSLQEKIKNFPKVDLELANGTLFSEKGEIQTVTGQINKLTGTVSFRALFNNPNLLISNGNSGNIHIPIPYKNQPVIPQSATYEQQGQVFVFKLGENDMVLSSPITIKAKIDNLYVIESGLAAGEKIVTNGVGKLRNNTLIKPEEVKFDSIIMPIKVLFK